MGWIIMMSGRNLSSLEKSLRHETLFLISDCLLTFRSEDRKGADCTEANQYLKLGNKLLEFVAVQWPRRWGLRQFTVKARFNPTV